MAQGVDRPVHIVAQAGQTVQTTFTVRQSGSYTFVCSQPGHAQAGMRGTLTAQLFRNDKKIFTLRAQT